jgi:hypothetical protein
MSPFAPFVCLLVITALTASSARSTPRTPKTARATFQRLFTGQTSVQELREGREVARAQ